MILFICSGNVARSQMAEAFYNHFSKIKNASSAGIHPSTPILYPKLPLEIIQIMKEENIDISNQKVKRVTKKMVEDADRIIIMCKKEYCPDFVTNSSKVIFWQIEDPFNMAIEDMRKIKNEIKDKVLEIIRPIQGYSSSL